MTPGFRFVSFDPVEPSDLCELREMARKIWPVVYRDIISDEQIEYMLELMYSPTRIAEEIKKSGIHYDWILKHRERVGFLAYGPVCKSKVCDLHKLYLLPGHRGMGLGSFTLQSLFRKLRAAEVCRLSLRVNRHNTSAIRCYEHNGFRKTGEDCLDIGGGHVMDDFLMSRQMIA
ncbi:MAG: GNAT family N-acetyltransferase [Verrucomicrobiales bacterium]|nr:GNAT family N-acetyltransferase [Verrucomicrobiales bacterium]